MGERVFDGLKVIDCASFIAGPAAATVMSDFGAAVIKIEPPGAGDAYRRRATPPIGPGLKSNPGFELDGRNKRSLALDLRLPAGQAVLRRLVRAADVFITNYPPPVRRRLGSPTTIWRRSTSGWSMPRSAAMARSGPRPTSRGSMRPPGGPAPG